MLSFAFFPFSFCLSIVSSEILFVRKPFLFILFNFKIIAFLEAEQQLHEKKNFFTSLNKRNFHFVSRRTKLNSSPSFHKQELSREITTITQDSDKKLNWKLLPRDTRLQGNIINIADVGETTWNCRRNGVS